MTPADNPWFASEDDGWRSQAACRSHDPQLFTDPQPKTDDTRKAIAICGKCPVRSSCLDDALTLPADADVGIWGGTTETARRAIRRKRHGAVRPHWFPDPAPATGLFETLDGELTDLTGRALVVRLPAPPSHLVLIDRKPSFRSNSLNEAWHHITNKIDELQPAEIHPFTLTADGDLADPTGRALITRLPAPPHFLLLIGEHRIRTVELADARQHALTLLRRHAPAEDAPMRSEPARSLTMHGR